ncbi:MAG TPA: NlpC/P60 family protein [Candidatus Anoxymicrobiaceae bacterium]
MVFSTKQEAKLPVAACMAVVVLALLAQCGCMPEAGRGAAITMGNPDNGISGNELQAALAEAKNAGADSRRMKVIEVALAELGKKYRWGGTGPDTWDCSGLMQHAFSKVGVKLPRVTYDQVKSGKAVREEKAEAGDLLFFYNNGHVGIYLGGGLMLNAHLGRVCVERVATYRRVMSAARRVLMPQPQSGKDFDVVAIPASAWQGVDVYDNTKPHSEPLNYQYGQKWQCVELVQRLYAVKWGYQPIWPVKYGCQLFDKAPQGIERHRNGDRSSSPGWGDAIVLQNRYNSEDIGHVVIVVGCSAGKLYVFEQNAGTRSIIAYD